MLSSPQQERLLEVDATGLISLEIFNLKPDPEAADAATPADPFADTYWLALWKRTHRWLANTARANVLFVCYEDLCRNPEVWENIAATCDVPAAISDEDLFRDVADADGDAESMAIYQSLRDRSLSKLAQI